MQTQHALTLAQSGQWQTLKTQLTALSPQAAYELIEAIGDACSLTLSLDGLVEGPEDILGLTVAGALLRSIGHRHRGYNTADKTSENQFELYYERLVQAKAALERALSIDRRNGLAAAVYMAISTDPIEEGQKEIAEARLLDAENVPLVGYMNLLKANLEKWGGSHEDMFRIARSRLGSDQPLQSALIAYAHYEREMFYAHFDDSPEAAKLASQYYSGAVLEELRSASRVILDAREVDPAEQRLADSWIALALGGAGESKQALRHINRQKGYTGGAWRQINRPGVWKFMQKMQALFA